jgi:hypothetical protein
LKYPKKTGDRSTFEEIHQGGKVKCYRGVLGLVRMNSCPPGKMKCNLAARPWSCEILPVVSVLLHSLYIVRGKRLGYFYLRGILVSFLFQLTQYHQAD